MFKKASYPFSILALLFISCSESENRRQKSIDTLAEQQKKPAPLKLDSTSVFIDSKDDQRLYLQYQDEFGNKYELTRGNQKVPVPTIIHDGMRNAYYPIISSQVGITFKSNAAGSWSIKTGDSEDDNSLNFSAHLGKVYDYQRNMSKASVFALPEQLANFQKREKDIQSGIEDRLKLLDQYADQNPMSVESKSNWKNLLRYQVVGQAYFGVAGIVEKIPKANLELLKGQIKDYFSHDDLLFIPDYKRAALHASRIAVYLETGSKTPSINEYCSSISKNFTGKTKDILLAKILSEPNTYFTAYKKEGLDQAIAAYLREGKTEEYKLYLLKSHEYKKGGIIADKLYNSANEATDILAIASTSAITYLDFWASWCGPCRAEMPASKKLKGEYKDKGIQFIYVSIDENPAAWIRATKQMALLDSESFLIPDARKSSITQQFKVNTIPRYILLDKKGSVIDADAPRPSDPNIKKYLNEALNSH